MNSILENHSKADLLFNEQHVNDQGGGIYLA
jgi:hypothetical protein